MFLWTLKQMIISILFIVIAHKIYGFFISQFTTPKVNDFVNKPNEEYMKILENKCTRCTNLAGSKF